MSAGRERESPSPPDRWLTLSALSALVPFLANLSSLKKLFWFGDSWDLLSQFEQQGLWRWSTAVFAENFVPVFKVLWIACIYLLGGSYPGMLAVMWITHALIVLLFGRLLRSMGFPVHGIVLAMFMLGVSWTNIETLTWSIQWSASLAVLFFLVAVPPLVRLLEGGTRHPARDAAVFVAGVSASALSFSRGVLSGPALAGLCLLCWRTGRSPARRALACAGAALVPPLAVAATIYFFSTGNHRTLGALSWREYRLMLRFGIGYLLLNPLEVLVGRPTAEPVAMVLFGLPKIALMAWALGWSPVRARLLLLTLLALEIGNAALLGLGRFHTGLQAATASRYQYNSLLLFGAALAFVYGQLLGRCTSSPARRALAAALVLAVWSGLNLRQWRRELRPWVMWRGVEGRALVTDPACHGVAMPGIPFLTCEQARVLAARFHLR